MNRRRFLTLSGAAASVSALGVASARDSRPGRSDLDEARERARALGKPLLVAFVPEYAPAVRPRGQFWGQMFSVGSDELLADLCLCELVFHPFAERRDVLGEDGPEVSDQDIGVLLETGDTRGVHVLTAVRHDADPPDAHGFELNDIRARSRADKFGALLRTAVAPDAETLARRAKECRASRPDAACFEAASFCGVRPRLSALDRIAACMRERIEQMPPFRETWIRHFAQAALLRLWEKDPVGARWDVLALDPCPPCGMGFVPESSRHFLELYTR